MSYGILATGTDLGGEFRVADTDLNLVALGVSIKGRASSFTLPSGAGAGFIFVKNPSVSKEFYKCDFSSGDLVSFIGFDIDRGGNPTSINPYVDPVSVDMDFFVLQEIPALSPSGNYGLQIFTSAGGLAFDSRRLITNESCEILQFVPPSLPTNYLEPVSAELTLSNTATDYVNIEWSGLSGNSVSGINFSGDRRYYYDADINEFQDGSEFLQGDGNYSAFIAARLR